MLLLFKRVEAIPVEPEPEKQSKTISPSKVVALIACSSKSTGFSAGCFPLYCLTFSKVHTSVNSTSLHTLKGLIIYL